MLSKFVKNSTEYFVFKMICNKEKKLAVVGHVLNYVYNIIYLKNIQTHIKHELCQMSSVLHLVYFCFFVNFFMYLILLFLFMILI